MSIKVSTLILLLINTSLLASCGFKTPPECGRFFTDSPNARSVFTLHNNGLASFPKSTISWSRCPAGQRFTRDQECVGEPIYLSFPEAIEYTQDLSEKSGNTVRMPTRDEIEEISESRCINPAIDLNIFPTMVTETFWTSSDNTLRSKLACSYYSFKGTLSCLDSKESEHPFLLVIEKDPPSTLLY